MNAITEVSISNFKSIKSININGCKRINLFIGSANVGKTNLLEALSLFSLPFLRANKSKKITHFLRLENEAEIFFNGNTVEPIEIVADYRFCRIVFEPNEGLAIEIIDEEKRGIYSVDEKLNLQLRRKEPYVPTVTKYTFSSQLSFERGHSRYLIPPYGSNLLQVIERDEQLRKDITQLFIKSGLLFVFDKASRSLKIMQKEKHEIFLIPYNSISDTLRRIFFYKAAIASNHGAIILFDGLEAHLFTPYLTHITQAIIYNKENQYFIATHSPFVLNDILENSKEDIAVFNVSYTSHQTHVRRLNEKELDEIYQNGVDLFTNNESYI